MSDSQLKLQIGEAEIQNAIAVALAEALSPERKDAMIRDIVRAHLTVKDGIYGRETVLGKTIGNLLRIEAEKQVREIFEDKVAPRVRGIVLDALGPAWVDAICTQLKTAIAKRMVTGITVDVTVLDVD